VKSSSAITHLGPDQREDTKWDENSEDFATSSVATAPASRGVARHPPHLALREEPSASLDQFARL